MKRTTVLATLTLTISVLGGAAFAEGNHGSGGKTGPKSELGMMQSGVPGGMGMMSGMDMMKRMHGNMMGGDMMGAMGPVMMQMFLGDVTTTPDEMRSQLQAKLAEYDSDADGSLSIVEFEALHSATIRELMVDRFQHLDADGDGTVTAEEMTAPAEMMERMHMMMPNMGNSPTQPSFGRNMGNGSMMNDN